MSILAFISANEAKAPGVLALRGVEPARLRAVTVFTVYSLQQQIWPHHVTPVVIEDVTMASSNRCVDGSSCQLSNSHPLSPTVLDQD